MTSIIQSIKGTRDFYPEDMAKRIWLYEKVRKVSESYGYQEFEGPILEAIDLYAAKSGDELVKEQSFVFPDRSGDLITLRPELTPTLARMVAQRQKQLIYPLRWWSFGPFWRYERPQKGRSREFFQWNIDLIGVDTPYADAELVAIIASFLIEVGLTPDHVKVFINNRELMENELNQLEIQTEKHPMIFRLLDRQGKMKSAKWLEYALELGLDEQQINGLQAILTNNHLWKKSEELIQLFSIIESFGIKDFVTFYPSIIRGLDYYTGTVFEAQEITGDIHRSILGGGRYNNLLEDIGGDPLPAVGFAMGDMVISLILEKHSLIPKVGGATPAQVLVTVFDDSLLMESVKLASDLRKIGLNVVCYPDISRLSKQFKYADRIKAQIALILGPDEHKNKRVGIKDLYTGEQFSTHREEIGNAIQDLLDRQTPS